MWLKYTSLGSSASMQTAQEAWHKLKIARILACVIYYTPASPPFCVCLQWSAA